MVAPMMSGGPPGLGSGAMPPAMALGMQGKKKLGGKRRKGPGKLKKGGKGAKGGY